MLENTLAQLVYPIWSGPMPSTKTSHFLFFPIEAWGKNYHSSPLVFPLTYLILGHIRPFCVLALRLVREQENIVVTFMVGPQVLEKTRAEVSRQFLDGSSDSVEVLKRIRWINKSCWIWNAFHLSCEFKDPFAADPALQPQNVRNESIGRCIPCSIPDSIRGQANYMFRNGYNIWCCSCTLCSCLRRKSVYWYVTCYGRRWCQLMIDCCSTFLLLVLCPSSIACY